MTIEWIDYKREPQCPPDPNYPNGRDIDGTFGLSPSCKFDLPYPAQRCGVYVVNCDICKQRIIITTAGRPDDPKSITVPCLISSPPQ